MKFVIYVSNPSAHSTPEFVVMPKENSKTDDEVSNNNEVKFEESNSLEELIENLTKQAFEQSNGE